MARYRLQENGDVPVDGGGTRMVVASPTDPVDIEVPDNCAPGRKWLPLDKAAQSALRRSAELRVARLEEYGAKFTPRQRADFLAVPEIVTTPAPRRESGPPVPMTLREAGGEVPQPTKRIADR